MFSSRKMRTSAVDLAKSLLKTVGECMSEHEERIENTVCAFNIALSEYAEELKNELMLVVYTTANAPQWTAAMHLDENFEIALCIDDVDNIEFELFDFAKNLTDYISASASAADAHPQHHYLVSNALSGKIVF
jgi:deoxyribodipyrimidine photolyase-like uncharacterized protein